MQKQKTYIVGNWKMHGTLAMARELAESVCARMPGVSENTEVVLCPPATLLREVSHIARASRVGIGGQDCHEQADGAFTGDISAGMLKDSGANYVILGHSERRSLHNEKNDMVRHKVLCALKSKLIPIVCIGETLAEREAGRAQEVVEQQLWESVPEEAREAFLLVAYEPVWAIGTGKVATTEDIRDMHIHIRRIFKAKTGLAEQQIFVLYGGSVKAAAAEEIFKTQGVSGVLVGGASLKAEEFCKIIESA